MSRGWARALEQHRAAVDALLETVRSADAARWSAAPPRGGWSAAQVAEHLALTLEGLTREARGEPVVRLAVGPLLERVGRWIVLPHILFHRSIPVRVDAPREVHPSSAGLARDQVIARFPVLARALEDALHQADRERRRVRHPFFGALAPARMLRFSAAHLEHHRRQIAARAGQGAAAAG